MTTTTARPLPADAIAGLSSIGEACEVLRGWGYAGLAERLAYFASEEDLDDGDVCLTLASALGFLAFFGAVETDGKVHLGCTTEGWICAEWDFPDLRDAGLWFLDGQRLMYTACGADGSFLDLDNDGSRVGDRTALTEKLVNAGLFTWFKTAPPTSCSHTLTT